jgi:hypothetical protein
MNNVNTNQKAIINMEQKWNLPPINLVIPQISSTYPIQIVSNTINQFEIENPQTLPSFNYQNNTPVPSLPIVSSTKNSNDSKNEKPKTEKKFREFQIKSTRLGQDLKKYLEIKTEMIENCIEMKTNSL